MNNSQRFWLSPIQEDLITILKEKGPLTRAELVTALGKARTTLYDNLLGLIQQGRVQKISRPINARGRPEIFFSLIEKERVQQ